jgi:putative endonuclease
MPSPTQLFGFARESHARTFLEEIGYRIEDCNWRGAHGEIDLIAWDGDILCFIEVRARTRDDYGFPEETVDRRKQRKLIRAALAYLMRYRPRDMPMARFDVIAVLREEIVLFKNAFDCG